MKCGNLKVIKIIAILKSVGQLLQYGDNWHRILYTSKAQFPKLN